MTTFRELKNQINLCGRAEYRYDRLVSDFSEHYLELKRSGYEVLPDLQILHVWLTHLNRVIRPTLLESWRKVAEHAGFSLGDLIEVDGIKLYAIRADSYPDLDYVRFTGFGTKKDLSPSRTSTTVEIKETTKATNLGKSLDASVIEPLFFEGSSRLSNVKEFLGQELSRVA